MIYIQKGKNNKYPQTIEDTWKLGDLVPEWLSDIAKVGSIDSETNTVSLITRDTTTGGYEIIDSSGSYNILTTKTKEDIICKSGAKIFSLTPIQFNLLYYGK